MEGGERGDDVSSGFAKHRGVPSASTEITRSDRGNGRQPPPLIGLFPSHLLYFPWEHSYGAIITQNILANKKEGRSFV